MQFLVQGYPAYAYTGGKPFDAALPADHQARYDLAMALEASGDRDAAVAELLGTDPRAKRCLDHIRTRSSTCRCESPDPGCDQISQGVASALDQVA